MHPLFTEKIDLRLPDSSITYFPSFLEPAEADSYFKVFKKKYPGGKMISKYSEKYILSPG